MRSQHEVVRFGKTSKLDAERRKDHEGNFRGSVHQRFALLLLKPANRNVPVQLRHTSSIRRPRNTVAISTKRRKHQHEKLRNLPRRIRFSSKLQQKRSNNRITEWLSILWKSILSRTKLLSKLLNLIRMWAEDDYHVIREMQIIW